MTTDFNPSYGSPSSFTPDDLFAGCNVGPVTEGRVTIVSGAGVLARGTVLGQITSGGKWKKSLSAASDGSQTPAAILAVDVDASAADVTNVLIYTAGEFNERKLILGTAHTAASTRDALRKIGIHLKDSVPA